MKKPKKFKAAAPFVRQVQVPIYDVSYLFVLANSRAESAALAQKHFNSAYGEEQFGAGSAMHTSTGQFGIFLLRDRLTHQHVAHEIFHNTLRIMDYIGVRFDPTNHEAFAYLNDWLHGCVYRLLRKAGETCV